MDIKTIKKSIEFYGVDTQSCVCMEEPAELIQIISKIKRYGIDEKTRGHLAEEMADVLICIELLKNMYGVSEEDLTLWVEKKQNRIKERMKV